MNAGYQVSRSHALAGSIKTDAPRSVIHDVYRAWIAKNPVKLENIKEGSPARVLIAKPSSCAPLFLSRPCVISDLLNREGVGMRSI